MVHVIRPSYQHSLTRRSSAAKQLSILDVSEMMLEIHTASAGAARDRRDRPAAPGRAQAGETRPCRTHMYVYIYIYIYVYTCTCVYVCMYVCMHVCNVM